MKQPGNFNKILSAHEANIISKISEGFNTIDSLSEELRLSESIVSNIIGVLENTNVIEFDREKRSYKFCRPIVDDPVLLDGDVHLPVSIFYIDNKMFVSRGNWYEFPTDFDLRRIIWNIDITKYYLGPDTPKTNITLFDLLSNQQAVAKTSKNRNKQIKEYEHLVNKYIPYSDDIKIRIVCVGEEITDIELLFLQKLSIGDVDTVLTNFKIRTSISTTNLIETLSKPVNERCYYEDLDISKVYGFDNIIFKDNAIPWRKTAEKIEYFQLKSNFNPNVNIKATFNEFNGEHHLISEEVNLDYNETKLQILENLDYLKKYLNSLGFELLIEL